MEYKFFKVQDFIKDDAFISWVKYRENDAFFQKLKKQWFLIVFHTQQTP